MDSNTVCSECDAAVRPLQQRLQCQNCSSIFHRICTSMKQDEYRKLKKENGLDTWECWICQVAEELESSSESSDARPHPVTAEPASNVSDIEGRNERRIVGAGDTESSVILIDSSVIMTGENNGNRESNNWVTGDSNETVNGTGARKGPVTVETSENNNRSGDGGEKSRPDKEHTGSANGATGLEPRSDKRTTGPDSDKGAESGMNNSTSSENLSTVSRNGTVEALVMFNREVLVSWTLTEETSGVASTKYIVKAIEVGTGRRVYIYESPVYGPCGSRRGSKIISKLAAERMYRFTVTYYRESEEVLSLKSENIWLGDRQRSTGSAPRSVGSVVMSSTKNSENSLVSVNGQAKNFPCSSNDSCRQENLSPQNTESLPKQPAVSSVQNVVTSHGQELIASPGQNPVTSSSKNCNSRPDTGISLRPAHVALSGLTTSTTSSRPANYTSSRQTTGTTPSGQNSSDSSGQADGVTSKQNMQATVSTRTENQTGSVRKDTAVSTRHAVPTKHTLKDSKYRCCEIHSCDAFKPVPKNHNIVEIEPEPFSRVVKDLLKLTPLEGVNSFTSYRSRTYNFRVDTAERNLMYSVPREVAAKRYQIQLRFCIENKKEVQPDDFPVGCVRVNGKWAQLQPVAVGCKTKSGGHPVDITTLCDIKSNNCVMVSWNHQKDKNHCMTVQFVEKLTANDLLKRLKESQYQHPHHTRDLIREKLKVDSDDEISTTSLRASLMCPIGHVRMSYPCVGSDCTHIQCVDAMTMLQMNEKKSKWKCLICSKKTSFDNLRINGYFMEVLSSVDQEVNDIEFTADGSWKVTKSDKNVEEDKTVDELSESVNMIDLTESDDENMPPSPVKKTSDHIINSKTTTSTHKGVAPLSENRNLLNSVMNSSSSVSSHGNVSSNSSASNRAYMSSDYSQVTVVTAQRNNHNRNHNNRPYEWSRNRFHNNSSPRNRYRLTESHSSNRRYNNCNSGYQSRNNYISNYSGYSDYRNQSGYNSYSHSNNFGQYRPWQSSYSQYSRT